jgi:hypothetical protein
MAISLIWYLIRTHFGQLNQNYQNKKIVYLTFTFAKLNAKTKFFGLNKKISVTQSRIKTLFPLKQKQGSKFGQKIL